MQTFKCLFPAYNLLFKNHEANYAKAQAKLHNEYFLKSRL